MAVPQLLPPGAGRRRGGRRTRCRRWTPPEGARRPRIRVWPPLRLTERWPGPRRRPPPLRAAGTSCGSGSLQPLDGDCQVEGLLADPEIEVGDDRDRHDEGVDEELGNTA